MLDREFFDIELVDIPKGLSRGASKRKLERRIPLATSPFRDRTGDLYGYTEVLGLVGFKRSKSIWLCLCLSCGKKRLVTNSSLTRMSDHPREMCCPCDKEPALKHWRRSARKYGLAEEWKNLATFLRDTGVRYKGTYLIPKNYRKPLGPSNFKWTSKKPYRRGKVYVGPHGKRANAKQWAKFLGIHLITLYDRFVVCDKYGVPREWALRKDYVGKREFQRTNG